MKELLKKFFIAALCVLVFSCTDVIPASDEETALPEGSIRFDINKTDNLARNAAPASFLNSIYYRLTIYNEDDTAQSVVNKYQKTLSFTVPAPSWTGASVARLDMYCPRTDSVTDITVDDEGTVTVKSAVCMTGEKNFDLKDGTRVFNFTIDLEIANTTKRGTIELPVTVGNTGVKSCIIVPDYAGNDASKYIKAEVTSENTLEKDEVTPFSDYARFYFFEEAADVLEVSNDQLKNAKIIYSDSITVFPETITDKWFTSDGNEKTVDLAALQYSTFYVAAASDNGDDLHGGSSLYPLNTVSAAILKCAQTQGGGTIYLKSQPADTEKIVIDKNVKIENISSDSDKLSLPNIEIWDESKVSLTGVKISKAGETGVSVGTNCSLVLDNAEVSGCETGIAAENECSVDLTNSSSVKNCTGYGIQLKDTGGILKINGTEVDSDNAAKSTFDSCDLYYKNAKVLRLNSACTDASQTDEVLSEAFKTLTDFGDGSVLLLGTTSTSVTWTLKENGILVTTGTAGNTYTVKPVNSGCKIILKRDTSASKQFVLLKSTASGIWKINNFTFEGGSNTTQTDISLNSDGKGGAVYLENGTLDLTSCSFANNSAQNGGAVYVESGTVNLTACTIGGSDTDANKANECGGGFYLAGSSASLTFNSGTIHSNSANHDGGAIYNEDGTCYIYGDTLIGKTVFSAPNGYQQASNYAGNGGAICVNGGTVYLGYKNNNGIAQKDDSANVRIMGNATNGESSKGGAVYVEAGTLQVAKTCIGFNYCENGGGIYTTGTVKLLEDAVVKGNNATSKGGGVYVDQSGQFSMTSNSIIGGSESGDSNTASFGGGVYVSSSSSEAGKVAIVTFGVTGAEVSPNISGNSATSSGGGIYITGSGATVNMHSGTISNNKVTTGTTGGGIYVFQGGTLNMEGGTISGNYIDNDSTSKKGGAINVNTSGNFNIKGTVSIPYGGETGKNDVCMQTSAPIKITGAITLPEGVTYAATVIPYNYSDSTQVLEADTSVTLANEVGKFAVKPDGTTTYAINSEGYLVTTVTAQAITACLSNLEVNTTSTPYNITLSASSADDFATIKAALNANSSKYVNITLICPSLTKLPEKAFMSCDSLVGIALPEGFTEIGSFGLYNCRNLSSLNLPSTLKSTSYRDLTCCTSLTSLTLPEGLETIYSQSIDYIGITTLHIPKSVKTIANDGIIVCDNLTSITVDSDNSYFTAEDGVLYNKDKTLLICYPGGKGGNFTIPNTVTKIGGYAFYSNTNITGVTIPTGVTSIGERSFERTRLSSITIPEGVTTIESGAFAECSSLTSLSIPSTVTSMSSSPCSGCTSLTSLTVAEGNSKYVTVDNVLFNKEKTKLICCAAGKTGSYTIPDGVTSIEFESFKQARISSVSIPNTVTSIGNYAFWCSNLESIVIPSSVTTIGNYALWECSSLTSVTFADTSSIWKANNEVIDISDPSENASNLKDTYKGYTWTKN